MERCWADHNTCLGSAVFFVHRNLEGAQESVVLRSKFDLAGSLESLRLFHYLGLIIVLFPGALVPPVKADRRFQNEEDAVAGPFDLAARFGDAVGFGQG